MSPAEKGICSSYNRHDDEDHGGGHGGLGDDGGGHDEVDEDGDDDDGYDGHDDGCETGGCTVMLRMSPAGKGICSNNHDDYDDDSAGKTKCM